MTKQKLLITDLDLTLLPGEEYNLDNNLTLFSRIVEKNYIDLCYSSGRSYPSILLTIDKYNLPRRIYIS